ncbi:MAG: hypothetical protein K6G84_07630 [Lachnospiraceae bacterium]|nr:hypothetical protein [Lachnospiraceae bacterium]
MSKNKETEKVEKTEVLTFAKDKIINSKRYGDYRDYLAGNLDDTRQYTLEEVDEILKEVR